jgi:hypothetical protein
MDSNNINLKDVILSTPFGEYNITEHVYNINIIESIYNQSITGTLDVRDPYSMMEKFPIIGDGESVTITWQTLGGNVGFTQSTEKTITLDVNKIQDETIIKNKLILFRLILVSPIMKKNFNKRVRKFYSGTQDTIVRRLVETQLEEKMLRVDPCEVDNPYVFPNLHPLACIDYLAKQAKSFEYGDPDYKFFQSLGDRGDNGFNFVSSSYMIDQPRLIASHGDDFAARIHHDIQDQRTRFNIESVHKKKSFNVLDNMNSGMFGSTMLYHDLTHKKWREIANTYDDLFEDYKHSEFWPLILMEGIAERHKKNNFHVLPTQADTSTGSYSNEYTEDTHLKRVIRMKQIDQNQHILRVHADPAFKIGYPMILDYKSPKSELSEIHHNLLHNKFLVTEIRHTITDEKYTMFVGICKDSYWKAPTSEDQGRVPGNRVRDLR